MTASPYADDFSNLAGWTASGMTTASGEVKASVDNSTLGKLTRTYETVATGSLAHVAVDFVVDTSMTANTYASVALLDSSSTFGPCIYIKQNVGIVCARYFSTPGYDETTTLLAWGSLINGGRYHVEWTVDPVAKWAFYSLYDPSGNLVTRGSLNANTAGWFDLTRVVIESNSTKTTVSRFAIDPNLLGSATTFKYFTNIAKFVFFLSDSTPVDLYIPGGGGITDLATYFHGSGQTPNFSEMTTYQTGGAVMRAFLSRGVMLMVPSIPVNSGGGDSWGNDYGAASVATAIAFVRGLIGNSSAPQHFISYSMGTLTAARLIGYDGQTNVQSWYLLRGVCDIAHTEQNTGFASAIDAAWGVAHQGSLSAAQTTFARGNPIGLLGTNPSAFSNVATYLDYSTTGDTTLSQANNCVPFDALLTTKGIAHKSSIKPYATHTEASTFGDATSHLSQVYSAAKISLVDVAAIAAATRDAIGYQPPDNDGIAAALAQATTAATAATSALSQATLAASSAASADSKATAIKAKTDNLSGSATSISQVAVPSSRTWVLKQTSAGLASELPIVRTHGETNQVFAIDWRNDLPNNGRVVSIDSVTILSGPNGGVTISAAEGASGVDRSQTKHTITLTTAGTYVIEVAATYDHGEGIASVTLVVT